MEIASGAAGAAIVKPEPLGETAKGPVPEAGAEDVARFQAALGTGPQEAGAAPPPGEVGQVGAVEASAGTPGDAILRGLERMGERFEGTMDRMTRTLESVRPGESLPAADLMRLQVGFMEVTTQLDLTGKVVGKATQNLDTFLKNQ
jgi:type III secretion system YscI/HrpB-like protein